MYILLNGEFKQKNEVSIDFEDRGYQFGDGVYEVIRVYNGSFFAMKEHMERFVRSAKEIKIVLQNTAEELTAMLNELLQKNQVQDGAVYMQITRGVTGRKHLFPGQDVKPQIVAYPIPCSKPAAEQEKGIKLHLMEDVRWLRCDIKSLNLLGNVLAKQEAFENGAYEALLHRGEHITEGSSSNFYGVRNGVIYTHPANNLILNGITRMKVVELCEKNGLTLIEEMIKADDLVNLDEAFITSTTSEVIPVIEIDSMKVSGGVPGPVTRELQRLFEEMID
jgi:D-alanine transaminase